MSPHQKRLLREWEKDDAAASHHSRKQQVQANSVCRYCKREFKCRRALGGHIKVHLQNRRKTNFTHRKHRKRADLQSSAPPQTRKGISSHCRKDKDRQVGGSDEVIDLSKSLSGYSWNWKCHRKRRCNEGETISTAEFADQDSDHDGDSIVIKRLRRSRTRRARRQYVCNICNVVFTTFHAPHCNVDNSDSSPNNPDDDDEGEDGMVAEEEEEDDDDDDDDDVDYEEEENDDDDDDNSDDEEDDNDEIGAAEEDKVEEVGAEAASLECDEVAEVKEEEMGAEAPTEAPEVAGEGEEAVGPNASTQVNDESTEARGNSGSMDQKASPPDPPKRLDFDLNEMPPEED